MNHGFAIKIMDLMGVTTSAVSTTGISTVVSAGATSASSDTLPYGHTDTYGDYDDEYSYNNGAAYCERVYRWCDPGQRYLSGT